MSPIAARCGVAGECTEAQAPWSGSQKATSRGNQDQRNRIERDRAMCAKCEPMKIESI